MSQNNETNFIKVSEQQIQDLNEYEKLFSTGTVKQNALKMALDIRKFEIELYWKRAGYFWAFIAVTFAAYFLVFNSTELQKNQYSLYNDILLAISVFGLFVSLCWFFVNKGAKYWQENWEKHVDMLEDGIIGPLYKTTINNMQHWYHKLSPFCSYKFSVGKINMLFSAFVVVTWIAILFNRLAIIHGWKEIRPCVNEIIVIVLVTFFTILLFFFCESTKSNGSKKFKLTKRKLN